jgi:hypothetical protein
MQDYTQDAFQLPATTWPTTAAPLRLWCRLHPVDAIRDALDIASWHDIDDGEFVCMVVEDDIADLHLPLRVFRRLTMPHEATVSDPDGKCLVHCEAVGAKALVAMLLAFASEAYTQEADTES